MKKLAVVICAVLQLSCGSYFLDQTVYRVFTYEPDGIKTEEEIMRFTQTVRDSLYQLQYCYASGKDQSSCYEYNLVDDQSSKEQVYKRFDGDSRRLWLVDFKEYTLNGKSYSVYKYLMNMVTTDGQSEHFWCPDFGIIIVKSSAWKNFKQLIGLQGSTQNRTIQALCEIVYNDQGFYTNHDRVQIDSVSSEIVDQISDSLNVDLKD